MSNDLLKKNNIIWDLDNTLYKQTPEIHDCMDSAMARALIEDLGVKLGHAEVKEMVKESYKKYRDGGQIFYKEYGIDEADLYTAYHQYLTIGLIKPYDNLLSRLESLPQNQFVFSHAPKKLIESTLKKIGLFAFFRDKIYSIEDFGLLKKNETPNVYYFLCEKIGADPKDCIFVDDSYSNHKYPKQIGITTVRISSRENEEQHEYIDYIYKDAIEFVAEMEKLSA